MSRAVLAAVSLLASAPNCPDLYSLAAHGFAVPTISARSASAATAASGLQVVVDVGAHNPNPFPIDVTGVDFDVAVEGTPAYSGSQQGVTVTENSDAGVQLAGLLSTASPAFRALRPGATAHYALKGTAHVASPAGVPVDVEFSNTGTFVVPQQLPAGR